MSRIELQKQIQWINAIRRLTIPWILILVGIFATTLFLSRIAPAATIVGSLAGLCLFFLKLLLIRRRTTGLEATAVLVFLWMVVRTLRSGDFSLSGFIQYLSAFLVVFLSLVAIFRGSIIRRLTDQGANETVERKSSES
jgi:hypothetical protein